MRLQESSVANQLALGFGPDDRWCPACRCWARPDCLAACPEPHQLAREYQAWRNEQGLGPSERFLDVVQRFEEACGAQRFPSLASGHAAR